MIQCGRWGSPPCWSLLKMLKVIFSLPQIRYWYCCLAFFGILGQGTIVLKGVHGSLPGGHDVTKKDSGSLPSRHWQWWSTHPDYISSKSVAMVNGYWSTFEKVWYWKGNYRYRLASDRRDYLISAMPVICRFDGIVSWQFSSHVLRG